MTISARLVLPLEAAGGGGDFRHVAAGRVVDEQRRAADIGGRSGSAAGCLRALSWPLRRRWPLTRAREQSSRSPSSSADISRLTNSTALPGPRSSIAMCSAMLMRQRRFAHAGPGGEDHQLRIVQAAGELVEVDEAGFEAAVGVLALHAGVDAGERFVQHVADRADLRVALGIEDAEHALLGAGEHLAGVDAGFVRVLDDVGAGVDQRAEHGLVADDAGVVLGVGGGGDFLAQLEQEGGAADRFVLAGVLQQLAEQRRIDLLAVFVQGQHVAEDARGGRRRRSLRAGR